MPFLVIYKFTSQFDRADASNRFILREEEGAGVRGRRL